MKTLKAICTAGLLALALSVPAYSGDVYTPGSANPGNVGTPGETKPTQEIINSPSFTATDPGNFSPSLADILLALISPF